jgi:XTP/dITP diphosphohydrolase
VGRVRAVFASRNAGKLRELEALLPDWAIEPLGAVEMPAETGETFYENAAVKARFAHELDRSRWAIGEDSGLEVEALGGAPGIRSARYGAEGGEAIERLLRELQGVEDRRARYVCELVLLGPDREELRGTGVLEGRIAEEPRGTEGFGYDPVFVPEGEERTVAELGNEWKSRNSHRARAAAALREAAGT